MSIFLIYMLVLSVIPRITSSSVPKLPHCADKDSKGLVLVNTLDGKLSILNHATGNEIWQMQTGPGPMLSSNIDRLELTNNGHWVRIIPSLAGNLYKFNGDTIDPIPLTADNLLTASFQYSDDLVIVGGKEIRTYGVTLSSGKLIYECSLSGCVNKTKNNNYEDFILVERNTHVIRAVEARFGAERWNFSVGQLNIKLPQLSCRTDNKINFNLKPVVSEGVVYSLGDSQKVLWTQKFDTPIVNIWTWDGLNMKSVNLFSNTQYSWGILNINSNIAPALYVGMHNKQLYVQESELMQKYLSTTKQRHSGELTEIKSVSQIPWKPFPASSSALQVVDIGKTIPKKTDENPTEISTTALSVLYASEYINGNGFYLYPNGPVDEDFSNMTIEAMDEEEAEEVLQVIIVSLWYWWKEVLVIAITTALAVNLLITQGYFKIYPSTNKYILVERHVPMKIPDPYNRTISESSDKEFTSRYVTDFNPIQCLGKGGFGIVFEAQNKIDECNYAVKRITLPNKQESRDRVMREVKILAKLEHKNIVRYFNAWLENPPPEWIANFDQEWKKDIVSTDGYDYTSATTPTSIKRQNSSVVINISQNNSSKLYSDSELKRRDTDSDSFIVFANDTDKESDTIEKMDDSSSAITETQSFDLLKNSKSNNITIPTSSTVFLYIQMQLCRKESLKDWLKDNLTRDTDHILDMFSQIVSAVSYVHKNGLIHRDLKPSNIFFSKNGQIKVGDFGLVTEDEELCGRENDDDEENPELYDMMNSNLQSDYFSKNRSNFSDNIVGKHTRAVGTQLYMSPEQLNGLSYNFKVDIYSLGVIFFEMLVPFTTTMERNKTLLDLRSENFPNAFCQDFKREHQLVSEMLSESPDDRPTSLEIHAKLPLLRSENLSPSR